IVRNPRAERAEGVAGLAAEPLAVAALPVTGADIVADGDAEDVLKGIGDADPAAGLADDDDHLALVLDAVAAGREHDRVAGVGETGVRFDEELGSRRRRSATEVARVIEGDGEHHPRHEGREELDAAERHGSAVRLLAAEEVALDRGDVVSIDDAVSGLSVG